MKLELVHYTCANCAVGFDAPALGESAYGEFLLWSKEGGLAYLNAFEDSTYKDVDKLLSAHPKSYGLNPLARAKLLRHIYGDLACDPDSKNSPFKVGAYPPCPSCGSQQMESWEYKNAQEIVDVPVSPVTHIRWLALTDNERLELLDRCLSAM